MYKNPSINKPSTIRKIYEFSMKEWWLSSLLFTMSSIWFILLQFFGSQWALIDINGILSSSGKKWTWTFIIINVLGSVLRTVADRKDTKKKSSGQYILQQLISKLNNAKSTKLDRYKKGIFTDNAEFDFESIVSPQAQIHTLLENIRSIVSGLSGTEDSKIGLSILHHDGVKWDWLDKINIDNDLNIDVLLENSNSTIRHIIDGKKQCIFWPDKQAGKESNMFIPSQTDEQYGLLGSIYCKDISIKDSNGDAVIKAILSITTYGNQICKQNDESEKSRFVADIMPEFELRLKVELCLLKMKEKNNQVEQKSSNKNQKAKKPAAAEAKSPPAKPPKKQALP